MDARPPPTGRPRASQPAPQAGPPSTNPTECPLRGALSRPPQNGDDGDVTSAAPSMAIQCSTGPLWSFELGDALDLIAEAGFSEIELMVTRDPKTQDPALPLRLATERGLRIGAVHAPFLVVTRSVWGFDPIAKVKRGVAMCAELGAGTLVVHPPYLWERRYAGWIRAELAPFAAAHGVKVAVETMYPAAVAGRRLTGYRWIKPENLAAAAPLVVMDTSHLAVAGFDIVATCKLFGPKLAHIHLSDNAGDGKDGHLEIGSGRLPLTELGAALRATGYGGPVCLEVSLSRHGADRSMALAVLKRNRARLEAALRPDDSHILHE